MPREHARSLRVAAQMQRLLNELLLSEVKDPRLAGARVSEVEVSGDLGVDPAAIKEGFEQARGFFRSRVGQALQLRRVPELRFRHDSSAKRAAELGQLIDDAGRPTPSD